MSPLEYFRFLGYITLNNVNGNIINFTDKNFTHRISLIHGWVTVSVIIGDDLCLKSQACRYNEDLTPTIKRMLEIKHREENDTHCCTSLLTQQ